jgi:membrane protein implicated in regulation of membrane protease activity
MLSDAETHSRNLDEKREVTRGAGAFFSRKVWLPKAIYVAIPYFYLAVGVAALLATLYIGNWLWVLPHYVFFSLACLHLGILVLRRRRRPKKRRDSQRPGPD